MQDGKKYSKQSITGKRLSFQAVLQYSNYRVFRRIFVAILLMYANYMMTGGNAVGFYTTKIFLDVGLSLEIASSATIGVYGASFIMACLGVR